MKNILLVHYNSDVVEKISDHLQFNLIDLTIAGDATVARMLLAKKPYDMMITASLLPKSHGFTLAKYVHETFPNTKIIILLDQLEDEEYLKEGYKNGACEILEKSVKGYVLQEKVLAHLDLNQSTHFGSHEGNSTRIDLKPLLYNLKSVQDGQRPDKDDTGFEEIIKDVEDENESYEIHLD